MYRQFSANQSQPLAHSDESDSRVGAAQSYIETQAGIHDPQADFIIRVTKFHPGLLCLTVFNHVAQRFLGNPEQAQRHIFRDLQRSFAVGKFNLNSILLADLFTKSHESGPETYVLQFAGMELMRKAMNVRRYFLGAIP